jgi:hypothetical protein
VGRVEIADRRGDETQTFVIACESDL